MSKDALPITTAAHLATEDNIALSEYEFGLTIANSAFQRWMIHCASAAGLSGLIPQDILIIHYINHRQKPKRIADISFVLNQDDSHTIAYSVRKLTGLGLVQGDKQGKEIFHSTTEQGAQFCQRYKEVRDACLVDGLHNMTMNQQDLKQMADRLRMLSGIYDQASRAAASR